MMEEFIKESGLVPDIIQGRKRNDLFNWLTGGQSLPVERTPARIPFVSINHEKRRRRI